MLRLAFLALLVSLAFHLLRRLATQRPATLEDRPLEHPGGDGAAARVREMVEDPVCGAFVGKGQALSTVAHGRVYFFCSGDCYRSFLLGRDRALERPA